MRCLLISLGVTLLLLPSACKPAMQAAKAALKQTPKAAAKKALHVKPTRIPAPAPRGVIPASTASQVAALSIKQRLPTIQAASKAVGEALYARRSFIPIHAYRVLEARWRQNDAELNSLSRQLLAPGLSAEREARLQAQVEEVERRNAEIEQLTKEWG